MLKYIYMEIYYYIYKPYFLHPPCNLGGGAGPLDSVEGPNVRYPVATLLNQSLLSRVGIYLLQNQEPSTALISDKKKIMFSTKSRASHVKASKQIKKYHLLS